jgi:hypothetical protein
MFEDKAYFASVMRWETSIPLYVTFEDEMLMRGRLMSPRIWGRIFERH